MADGNKKRATVWHSTWREQKDELGDLISVWCDDPKLGVTGNHVLCKVCKKMINFGSHGIAALAKHSGTALHTQNMAAVRKTPSLHSFFRKAITDADQQVVTAGTSIVGRKSLIAEIRWAMHIVEQNYSFMSNDHVVSTFEKMFSDSSIPSTMSMKRMKLTYLVTDALYPYVSLILKEELANVPFSLHVDEGNKSDSQYLAVVIRYLEKDSWKSRVTCLDMPRLVSSDSESIVRTITETIHERIGPQANLLALMTDNCNTMRGLYL